MQEAGALPLSYARSLFYFSSKITNFEPISEPWQSNSQSDPRL